MVLLAGSDQGALASSPADAVIVIADPVEISAVATRDGDFLAPLVRLAESHGKNTLAIRGVTVEDRAQAASRLDVSQPLQVQRSDAVCLPISVRDEPQQATATQPTSVLSVPETQRNLVQCAAAEPVPVGDPGPDTGAQNEYLPALLDLVALKSAGPVSGLQPAAVATAEGEPSVAVEPTAPKCLVAISQLVDAKATALGADPPGEAVEETVAASDGAISPEASEDSSTGERVWVAHVQPRRDDSVGSSIRVTQAVEELVATPHRSGGLGDERPMSAITTNIRPPVPAGGEQVNLPPNAAGEMLASRAGEPDDVLLRDAWMRNLYAWEASLLCHRPLYFEEINVERYGYSPCPLLQPIVSGAQFFATVPILPYKMAVAPPREGVFSLGYYRPGSVAPYQLHWIPLRPKAGLVEAGVITGLIFAIP